MNNSSFDKDYCEYSNLCKNYGDEERCRYTCPYYYSLEQLLYENNQNQIGFPSNWEDSVYKRLEYSKDSKKYDYLRNISKNIVNWIEEGNNLYLYSTTFGNGKTTSAIKLAYAGLTKLIWRNPMLNDEYNMCIGIMHENYIPVIFINVVDFLIAKKESIGTKDRKVNKLMERIREAKLVVWDDIGNIKLSDYECNLMYSLINDRIGGGKANIFTSNVIDEELIKNVGPRIASRILETSQVIEFTNPSFRYAK